VRCPLLKSKRLLSVPNRHLSYLVTSCGLRAMEGRMEISPENIKEALDLSMAFEIVFRALGQEVLSHAAMQEFETTLSVVKVESH
jgi:hypothetical protein